MRKIFDVELSAGNGLFTELALPATPYAMLDAREKLRLEEGEEPNWNIVRCFDGQRFVEYLDTEGSLPKYKAVLETAEIYSLDTALLLADELDQYTFSPNLRTVEEVALEKLHTMLDEDEVEFMRPYVNLYTYGQALVEQFGARLTEYGSVERIDGEPIQQMEPEPTPDRMEMMM